MTQGKEMNKKIIACIWAVTSLGNVSLISEAAASDMVHEMIYKTCRELDGDVKQQETLMGPLVDAAAEIYQVNLKDPATIQNIAWLIRTGCSVWPDAYASAITAKSVRLLGQYRKPIQTRLFPDADIALTDCDNFEKKTLSERKRVTDYLSGVDESHYKRVLPTYWSSDYLINSIHNACQLAPGTYVFEIIGQLIRTSTKLESGDMRK